MDHSYLRRGRPKTLDSLRSYDHIAVCIHTGWRQERSVIGLLSTDGTFPQRCRLAHTDRNRGTRAAVLFDIRTIDLAHGALAEAAGGNAAITLLADDRGDLTGGLRLCGPSLPAARKRAELINYPTSYAWNRIRQSLVARTICAKRQKEAIALRTLES